MKPLAWLTSHKSTASIFKGEETRTWVNKLHRVLAQRILFPNFTVYYTRKLLIAPPPHYSVFRHATGSQPLPVAAYFFFPVFLSPISFPVIFLSLTCCRRHFIRKTWPIHLTFIFLFTVCKIVLSSLPVCNTSFLTRSVQMSFSISICFCFCFSIFLQHHFSKLSRY